MRLFPYQQTAKNGIAAAWGLGVRNVLFVLPTRAGKTVVFSAITAAETGRVVLIAHRQEILGQIAMTLARWKIPHHIIASRKSTVNFGAQQREVLGRSFIDPGARVAVASVDTLLARQDTYTEWGATVSLWVQDEAHHVLDDNKWGRVLGMFPHARGLGVTATPIRLDGRSLARNSGGVFDILINGPSQRALIDAGYLADYRIFAPKSDIDIASVKVTRGGEFNHKQLTEASRDSSIIGDVVGSYRKYGENEKGVTFVVDIKTAGETALAYRDAGIPAIALSGVTKQEERFQMIRAYKNGELQQLVNVDLFGEGFDLPELVVVSMARPTMSFARFSQMFGRMLTKSPRKKYGILIDHVWNLRHGLPDRLIKWELGTSSRRVNPAGDAPLRVCSECIRVWQSYSRRCPHCDYLPEIIERQSPEQVEGDISELSPEILRAMRGEIERVDMGAEEIAAGMEHAGAPQAAIHGLKSKHRKRQEAQHLLREIMSLWGGGALFSGIPDSIRYKKFYSEFGIDVLSAQALGRPEAEELTEKVKRSLTQFEEKT